MNIVDQLLKIALLGSAWVLYLLLVLSVLSIGVMFERFFFFRKNGRGVEGLRDRLVAALRANDEDQVEHVLRSSGSVEGNVVASAFVFRDGGSHAVSEALEAEMARARKELERGTNFLGTIGNNGPFIGLLGTVIGVIDAFRELGTASARQGAMGNVMAGIAEALVATGVGLFVALPAVIAYNVIQGRIGSIESDTSSLGRLVSAWLETRARGGVVRELSNGAATASTTDESAQAGASFVAATEGE